MCFEPMHSPRNPDPTNPGMGPYDWDDAPDSDDAPEESPSGVGRSPVVSRMRAVQPAPKPAEEVKEWMLEVKYVEEIDWEPAQEGRPFTSDWEVDSSSPPVPELPESDKDEGDRYANYPFTHNCEIAKQPCKMPDGTTVVYRNVARTWITWIEVRSPMLKSVGLKVMGNASYNRYHSHKWDPDVLLSHFWHLQSYLNHLRQKAEPSQKDKDSIAHLNLLLTHLRTEYRTIFDDIREQTKHGRIRFDSLWAILIPGTIFYLPCEVSEQPRAVRLVEATWNEGNSSRGKQERWRLKCEYIDCFYQEKGGHVVHYFGFSTDNAGVTIDSFEGTKRICDLPAYPLEYHPGAAELKTYLIARGKRWCELRGIQHKFYDAVATSYSTKIHVNSRIILDRTNYSKRGKSAPSLSRHIKGKRELGSSYRLSTEDAVKDADIQEGLKELSESDLILTSPLLYGFSLVNKEWYIFSVHEVKDIKWNEAVFDQLVLPAKQKNLVKSLVMAHNALSATFDDFIEGKGQGLVVNIFGNPGVGKTLTAEATSEHLKKPLYVVSAVELGTKASELDDSLNRIFDLTGQWGAVVLIDEADIFLEQRSLSDIARNAMVAVFLRQLEYFRSILFLTTNRVRSFDVAFQSRIHESLHYGDLTEDSKAKIWISFVKKARESDSATQASPTAGLSEEQLKYLMTRNINGRQIKNAVRTACAIASSQGKGLEYEHLVEVLDIMDEFDYVSKFDETQAVPI